MTEQKENTWCVLCMLLLLFLNCCKEKEPDIPYFGVYRGVPVSSIEPQGWLKELLERQRDGLGLHRAESGYPYNTCLWNGIIPPAGNASEPGWWVYEQTGYIVDGLYRCGLLLKDSSLQALGRENVEYVISHHRCSGAFPAYDLSPASAWNYAISENDISAIDNKSVVVSTSGTFPWDQGKAPLALSIKAYRVPAWKADKTTPALPEAGFQTVAEPEEIKLVPYGSTRLRVTVFPVK